MSESVRRAMELISAIKNSIEAGTKHYDKNGKELGSIKEVLEVLRSEGEVTVEPRKAEERQSKLPAPDVKILLPNLLV